MEKVALGQDFLRILRFPRAKYNFTSVPVSHFSSRAGIIFLFAVTVPRDSLSLHSKNKKGFMSCAGNLIKCRLMTRGGSAPCVALLYIPLWWNILA
jgi:hypothetical protein